MNPAIHSSPPRIPRSNISPPEPEDVRTLLKLAADDDPALAVFLHLAVATGARRGELCALRWSDVDLDAGTLLIAKALVHGAVGVIERDTKTHASRQIALDGDLVEVLRDHRMHSAERAVEFGGELTAGAHVFSFDPTGETPWRPTS